MKTSIISVKIDEQEKKAAQDLADELGFTLSSLVKGFIKDFLRKREVSFDLREAPLIPTEYLKRAIAEAEEDVKAGRVSPSFRSAAEAEAWLDDPNARFRNGDPVQ